MYEYRLWIELSESTEESDCGQLAQKVELLKAKVSDNLKCLPINCIMQVNYATIFQCSGGANHRGAEHDKLLDVLQFLVELLPGSHGLVYWSDDENPGNSVFDGYKVLVVARGTIIEKFDPFLSPRNPTVED
ncbi:Imm7 family immunity protein [Bremerella cremea]|nr:Imm7 family immunity protein [Bremerella cremea]